MFTEPTNEERAENAAKPLTSYAKGTGMSMKSDAPAILADLLADLMHLAKQRGLDFDAALATAGINFTAECEEGQ